MDDEEYNGIVINLFDKMNKLKLELELEMNTGKDIDFEDYKRQIFDIREEAASTYIALDLEASEQTIINMNDMFSKMETEINNMETTDDIMKFFVNIKNGYYNKGGRRRNHPKHTDMTMKDIKELCKANQIKLSKVVDDKRVCYKKKELLTKLKRKKVI